MPVAVLENETESISARFLENLIDTCGEKAELEPRDPETSRFTYKSTPLFVADAAPNVSYSKEIILLEASDLNVVYHGVCEAEYNNEKNQGQEFLKRRKKFEVATLMNFDLNRQKGGLVVGWALRKTTREEGEDHHKDTLVTVGGSFFTDDDKMISFGRGTVPHRNGVELDDENTILHGLAVANPVLQKSAFKTAKELYYYRVVTTCVLGNLTGRQDAATKSANESTQNFHEKRGWDLSVIDVMEDDSILKTYETTIADLADWAQKSDNRLDEPGLSDRLTHHLLDMPSGASRKLKARHP